MQSWLEGRNWVGKCAQASLRILSSKADSNTWESFTRGGLKLESVHQESPRSDIFRKRATKPLLKQKRRQKHPTWAKEKNNCFSVVQTSPLQIKVIFAFHLEIKVWGKTGEAQNLTCLKSRIRFLKSVMIWGVVMSAGVGSLWFIKSKVNAAVYQEILKHFMLPSADKLYGDADFDFNTCPRCPNHFQDVCWPWYYCVLQILFMIDLRKYYNILRYWIFYFHEL